MIRGACSCLRSRVIGFLIQSAQLLEVSSTVKYSALSLFADRFYPSLSKKELTKCTRSWLLKPIGESNLQLFALVSIWVSSKIHDTPPLSVKSLKLLGDKFIKEQCFTKRDFLEAEMVFMQVVDFEIGTSNIAFLLLQELRNQLKVVVRAEKHVDFDACMDIMDLLYEKEVDSVSHCSPCVLAASVLVASYVISVPIERWEFPILPWVKFITPCKEEEILDCVRDILNHIFDPQED